MRQRNRQRKAAHDRRGREPVAKVQEGAVVVCREVVCAGTARADGVGQRREHVEERNEERQPVAVESAAEDDEEKAEG